MKTGVLAIVIGLACLVFSIVLLTTGGCRPDMTQCGPTINQLAGLLGLALVAIGVARIVWVRLVLGSSNRR